MINERYQIKCFILKIIFISNKKRKFKRFQKKKNKKKEDIFVDVGLVIILMIFLKYFKIFMWSELIAELNRWRFLSAPLKYLPCQVVQR